MPFLSPERFKRRPSRLDRPLEERARSLWVKDWTLLVLTISGLLGNVVTSFASSFGVVATDIAPATVLDGQEREIFRVAVTNPVVSGPLTLRLASLGLRFTQANGVGLTTNEGSDLFAAIEVYLDANESGTFEAGTDPFISALFSPDLATDGGLAIDLSGARPADVQVASGVTRTYFLVVQLTPAASTANPNSFRITHLASGAGATSAVDALSNLASILVTTPNIASAVVTATFNQPPTTTGIADVLAYDNAAQGMIPLYPAFDDAEDGPSQLSYTLTQNSNPALLAFAGIEPATGKLLLTYAPGLTGVSALTIKATDTLGKSVTTTFQVKVTPFITYSDFQSIHPAAGGPLEPSLGNGQLNLFSYAFFLNQGSNGGTLGLPRLQGTGNARIFTHLRPKLASDVFYNYQLSQDLQNWAPAVRNVDYYQSDRDLGDGSVRVELLLLNGSPKTFMRAQTQLVGSPAPPAPLPPPPAAAPETAPPGELPPLPPPPSSGVPISPSPFFPSQTILSSSQAYASGLYVKDLDNDGKKDVLAASQTDNTVAWYHNNGDGTFGAKQVITTLANGATAVRAADLDNDGRVDIVASSLEDGKVAWYKRNADGSYTMQPLISANGRFPTSVDVADLNNDGKPDVIWASWLGSFVAWSRNLGGGAFAAPQIITTQSASPWSVVAADIDADGIRDLVIGSVNDSSVAWYKGLGNGVFGTKRTLATGAHSPLSVDVADVDGDGALDVVSAYAADNLIVWFKNLGNGNFGVQQTVSILPRAPYSAFPCDLDGDGKTDILSASFEDNKVAWYRNTGNGNFGDPNANQIVISTEAGGAVSVAVGDFNQDGAMDVASVSQADSKVAVYINRGAQSGLSTTDVAPPAAVDGQQQAMLRIEVSNHGVTGNDNARLDTVALLFESSPGVPLTTAQANALVEKLFIYADTNDTSAFEKGSDLPVAVFPYLTLNAGRMTLAVRGNALAVQIAPGTTRDFFVVPQLTANAASQIPSTLRITHLMQGPGHTTARDAFSNALLSLEPSANNTVASSTTNAQPNQPPATIGLPNITVSDTKIVSTTMLPSYFSDAEDGASALQYLVVGNSNPGLFSFVGLDSSARLIIRYRAGVAGASNLTVRATDSLGKSVTSTFTATVALADTFAHWSAGGGGAGSQPDLLRYAFGLTPFSGSEAGLPRLNIQGRSRVVSHQKPMWATDLAYQYEVSPDMVTWFPAIPEVHYHEFSKELPNSLRQSDCVLLVNWPKAFMRVRASLAN